MKAGKVIGLLLAVTLLFTFGFAFRDLQRGDLPPARAVNALLGLQANAPTPAPEQVFRQNYTRILNDYYRPVKAEDLKFAGMEGLLASLGDPHTVFMVPRAAQEFSQDTRGNFVGVGARLMADPLGAKVAVVFEDGPAWKAGLRANDIITTVNGKSMAGTEIDKIVDQIRGPEGTTVRLGVLKAGKGTPTTLPIRRAQITIPSVTAKRLPDTNVGWMEISGFSEPTVEQFDRALEKLEETPLEGLIIDVRGNPGGLLESAVDVLSRFTPDKVVVKMKFRDGREEVVRTDDRFVRRFPYPIVVLMNEESASAAEIFAGVLRDYRLATLVGEHSYGKASVQNVFPLIDRSSAKITIARYYLPGGADIGRRVDEDGAYLSGGLEPEIKVEPDLSVSMTPGDPKTDAVLRRGLEVIREKRQ